MRINDLTQFQIEAVENRENFLSKFREKGIENAEKLNKWLQLIKNLKVNCKV